MYKHSGEKNILEHVSSMCYNLFDEDPSGPKIHFLEPWELMFSFSIFDFMIKLHMNLHT